MPARACVSATVTVPSDKHAEGKTLLHDVALKARQDPGCLRFVVYENKEKEGHFSINEEWENDSFLQDHLKLDHVVTVFSEIEKIGGKIDNTWCRAIV